MTWQSAAAELPIRTAIEPLRAAMQAPGRAVLHAPPGAGKTTIVPLALLDEEWCTGTILVLEPRRLAVRSAATRLADLVGERPGNRVGWRMRQDTKVSARTEIEVITEGVLTRRLQRDPELSGVSAVVFDEFHERSLDADLGLALTLEVADALRPDLRLLVMSATLDTEPIARLLGGAPVVRSEGRMFPVDIVHLDTDRRARMEGPVAAAVTRALAAHGGDVLVFLPGAAEIDRVRRALGNPGDGVDVRPLYGALAPAAQDAAITPCPTGRRKVVLATSIAETSLTIEGVTVVVDAGWRRTPRLDAGSGMTRLATLPVTRAEADQRAGRAGRLSPGTAYRLWSRAEDATLKAHPEPEIEVADLSGLALELAAWGASESELAFLTPPPAGHLAAARDLLRRLDAFDDDGSITAHGRRLAELPLHPRLAHLVLRGAELGHGGLAADTAAALHESGLRSRRTDVAARLEAMRRPNDGQRAAAQRARADAKRYRGLVGAGGSAPSSDGSVGLVVALGYPDRIGKARPGQRGEFLLSGGRGVFVDGSDPLAAADYLAVADLDGQVTRSRVFLAAPLDEADIRAVAGDDIETTSEVRWDPRSSSVVARTVERLGAVELSSAPLEDPPSDLLRDAWIEGLRSQDVGLLHWDTGSRDLQARLQFLHRLDPARWPDVGDDALAAGADTRIGPYLGGVRRRRDLARVDVREVLLHGLAWSQRADIDRLAPERLEVPSGHRHRVDYSTDPPVLAVKLQELFGSTDTPTVADGAVAVVLHLLSPAGRPLQVTQDLASFWAGAYTEVRGDMRGRYPKHPWPDDPTAARPTARTKRRS